MNNLSARVRILLLVVISALPILGVAVYTSLVQRNSAEMVERQSLQLIASLIARRPEQIIHGASQLLFAVTMDFHDLLGDRNVCKAHFRNLLTQTRGLYRNMGLILPDGNIYCNSTAGQDELDVKAGAMASDSFQMAISSRKFVVGGFQAGQATGLPGINFFYPVLGNNGNVIAVAYAFLNLGTFEEQEELRLQAARTGKERSVTIIDNNGFVLAQFPQTYFKIGEKIPSSGVFEHLAHNKTGLFTETAGDGEKWLTAFHNVDVNPDGKAAIHVIVSTPFKSIYAESDRLLWRMLYGVAAATVLLFVLAWYGAEVFVTRRFRVLLGLTERVRAGDFSARSGFGKGGEEFNRLGAAFDEMTSELQSRDAQLQDALERLRAQAVTDELTGLYNRRYLWNAMEAELTRARRKKMPTAVMLFDIDHFKKLNDLWGHQAGDMVLKCIAKVVRRVVRGTDIVARYGGEEFIVVMPEASEEVALLRARELRARIAEMPLSYEGASLGGITVSIGIGLSADASQSGDVLVREADAAMYEAKTRGRDQVVMRKVASKS